MQGVLSKKKLTVHTTLAKETMNIWINATPVALEYTRTLANIIRGCLRNLRYVSSNNTTTWIKGTTSVHFEGRWLTVNTSTSVKKFLFEGKPNTLESQALLSEILCTIAIHLTYTVGGLTTITDHFVSPDTPEEQIKAVVYQRWSALTATNILYEIDGQEQCIP